MEHALTSTSVFPVGAEVSVFPVTARRAGDTPIGDALGSEVMGLEGVTFSGLSPSSRYVAYALVGGEHRYVAFSTPAEEPVVELDPFRRSPARARRAKARVGGRDYDTRFPDRLNAKEHFGVGTQATDEENAVQLRAALEAAAGGDGGGEIRPVYLPAGEYNGVTQVLEDRTVPVRLIGDGEWTRIYHDAPGSKTRTVITATGESFTLTWKTGLSPGGLQGAGETTPSISSSASAAIVEAALEGLSTIGLGGVSVDGPAGGPWVATFNVYWFDGALTATGATVDSDPVAGSRLFFNFGTFDYLGEDGSSNDWENGQPLTQAAARGDVVLHLGSTDGLEAGDWIEVRDEGQQIVSGIGDIVAGVQGQKVRVAAVGVDGANTVRLRERCYTAYTTSALVRKVNMVDRPYFEGLSFEQIDPGFDTGAGAIPISLNVCYAPVVRNIDFFNFASRMISMTHCVDGLIENVRWRDARNDFGGGPYGALVGAGCQNVQVLDSTMRYGRHLITSTGATHDVPASFVRVARCVATEMTSAAFSTHRGSRWWQFQDCIAIGSTTNDNLVDGGDPGYPYTGAFQVRGNDTTLERCKAFHCPTAVLLVVVERTKLIDFYAEGCDVGLLVYGGTGLRSRNIAMRDITDVAVWVRRNRWGETHLEATDMQVRGELDGDVSDAAVVWESWDSLNESDFRAPDATVAVRGQAPRVLQAAAVMNVPRNANYWEVEVPEEVTTVSRIARARTNEQRELRLLFRQAVELAGDNLVTSDDGQLDARTEITIASNGEAWVEQNQIVVPFIPPLGAVNLSPFGAYSVARLLRSGYSGDAIKVIESGGSTEADIGFDALGGLDITALLEHCDGADGFITKIYDQSGNGYDLAPPASGARPQIVDAGDLITLGGRPAMLFDGTDDLLVGTDVGLYVAGESCGFAVVQGWNASNNTLQPIYGEFSSSVKTRTYTPLGADDDGGLRIRIRNDAGTLTADSLAGGANALAEDTAHQVTVVDTGSVWTGQVDGGLVREREYTRAGTVTVDRFMIGGKYGDAGFFKGLIAELIVAADTPSRLDVANIATSQKAHFGTGSAAIEPLEPDPDDPLPW